MPSRPSYNCTRPQPSISVNPDITGRGVIANYIGTAGIAVLLTTIYFLLAYEPREDPFRKTNQDVTTESFRVNQIDDIIVRTICRPWRSMGSKKIGSRLRIERTFVRCILAMSDLQIVTGLSILISGYKQLFDGLSTYHWMTIICLAWFSNITHLVCLTLLRNHLYNHPVERAWRLLSMTALVILLVTALSFTGSYEWTSAVWNIEKAPILLVTIDPAMCHLGTESRSSYSGSSYSYYAMIVSMVLIIFGFVARILKMFKSISIGICGRIRSWLSIRARGLLSVVYDRFCSKCSSHSLRRTLLYRPLLTIFLIGRLFLESCSSTSLEVGWLFAGFGWGVMRLRKILQHGEDLQNFQLGMQRNLIVDSGDSKDDWGFGQVVAVVLLIAPLVGIFEYIEPDPEASLNQKHACGCNSDPAGILGIESQSTDFDVSSSPDETPRSPEDPDSDWVNHRQTVGAAILYFILICTVLVCMACGVTTSSTILDGLSHFFVSMVLAPIGLLGVILFSLMIEINLSSLRLRYLRLLQLINILFFASASLVPIYGAGFGFVGEVASYGTRWASSNALKNIFLSALMSGSFMMFGFGFYFICALVHRVRASSTR